MILKITIVVIEQNRSLVTFVLLNYADIIGENICVQLKTAKNYTMNNWFEIQLFFIQLNMVWTHKLLKIVIVLSKKQY